MEERERDMETLASQKIRIREEISERSEKEVRGSPFFEERERERVQVRERLSEGNMRASIRGDPSPAHLAQHDPEALTCIG